MDFPYKKFSNIKQLNCKENIFFATIDSTSHKVVIKKIISNISEYNYKKFDNNVKTIKSLHHNNIINIFDYGVYKNNYYISMEYIEGFDLEQLLAIPSFDKMFCLIFVFKALTGLMHAHDHGVYHCNVKLSNIIVSKDGTTKLADFSITHVTDLCSSFTTLLYMPPEQLNSNNEETLDEHIINNLTLLWDIWSVGVLLYRVCTGKFPFLGDNKTQLADSILTLQPLNIRHMAPFLSSDVAHIIESCLIKDPRKRLSSLTTVITTLQLFILSSGVKDVEETVKKHLHQHTNSKIFLDEHINDSRKSSSIDFLESFKTIRITTIVIIILLLYVLFFSKKHVNSDLKQNLNQQYTEVIEQTTPVETIEQTTPAETTHFSKPDSVKSIQNVYTTVKKYRQVKSKTMGNCFLNIYTVPWSNVYIDGLNHGTAPTPSLIDLTEGDHVIILEHEGFLPVVQNFSIKAGDTIRLKIYLKKQ